ncbi:uncharacterized protein METZ01_LOCUS85441 [marine metagenome]|uniref:Uncharacterized protein n=1 Tax=marine metagenome TaxID=408172 RepID=A0A381UYY9_9ZZZZ|tara:strand:- start:463 stop:684 length:222 start_codon:yes stop_codon:yes gene_type:complete
MMDNVIGWIKSGTHAGIALIGLTIVLQVVFGSTVPFLSGDVIGTITGIVQSLGEAGLVGLLSAAIIYRLFTKD